MNIKPDDKLAYTVGCRNPANNGRIVEIKSFAGIFSFADDDAAAWNTKPVLKNIRGNAVPVPDANLRPIRDQPGQDETLQWAPVPGKLVTA